MSLNSNPKCSSLTLTSSLKVANLAASGFRSGFVFSSGFSSAKSETRSEYGGQGEKREEEREKKRRRQGEKGSKLTVADLETSLVERESLVVRYRGLRKESLEKKLAGLSGGSHIYPDEEGREGREGRRRVEGGRR